MVGKISMVGGGCVGGSVAGGGCVGGLVGGGGGVGGLVGGGGCEGGLAGGGLVGGTDALVEAGLTVGGTGIGVSGISSFGLLIRSVAVRKGVGVLEGMGVSVCVAVKVFVGVFEAVAVGAVAVGKGPISALSVIASAVLVLFAFLSASPLLDGSLKAIQSTRIKPMNRAIAPTVCR